MATQWLYEQILKSDKDWKPDFALPSTLNWMHALSHEIRQEHSMELVDQFAKLRSHFQSHVTPLSRQTDLAPVFGSLFHSLTFSQTLTSMAESHLCRPWMFSTGIVAWYYSVYNAFRSVVAASGNIPPETHTGLQKCLQGASIRPKLPYPFNMVAEYQQNEEYKPKLPEYPEAVSERLEQTFIGSRPQSQGMLLGYLNGTANWQVCEVKQNLRRELRRELNVDNFRTKKAQQKRNERLKSSLSEVNFLHCAFRYRGKANYRDSVFLAYGQEDSRINVAFIESLDVVARFAFLCGLAYAERRIGKSITRDFLVDLSSHVRGQAQATPTEKMWATLLSEQY